MNACPRCTELLTIIAARAARLASTRIIGGDLLSALKSSAGGRRLLHHAADELAQHYQAAHVEPSEPDAAAIRPTPILPY